MRADLYSQSLGRFMFNNKANDIFCLIKNGPIMTRYHSEVGLIELRGLYFDLQKLLLHSCNQKTCFQQV